MHVCMEINPFWVELRVAEMSAVDAVAGSPQDAGDKKELMLRY